MLAQAGQSLWRAPPDDGDRHAVTLGEALARSATAWPEAEAVVYACQPEIGDVRWTFAALDDQATRLARALLEAGYRPGERVAIWGSNHPAWIQLEFALARAGLVVVAVNPLYQDAELHHALAASDVVAVFHAATAGGAPLRATLDRVRPRLPRLRGVHSFEVDVPALLAAAGSAAPLPAVDADALFMIQYTSGTTGVPKAAHLSHAGIASGAARAYRCWQFGPGDRVCHGFPLFHIGGSGNSTPGALINGAATLPIHIFRAGPVLDILERERCTGFIGVPTMLAAMLEEGSLARRDLSALRRIVVGGAPVPPAFLRRCEDAFGVEMLNGYGQTESCGVTASVRPGDPEERKIRTSGLALPGIGLKVVGPDGAVLPCGAAGELCVAGHSRMLRYGDEAATRAAFDADGWLRTGDIATMDGEGYVAIVGRLKEMIIRGGENLYPAEIERYLCEHPDVAEVAVIGLPDARYGEEMCAVVRPARPDHVDAEALRAWCRARVSRWKVPRYIAFVPDFPTTPSGKIRKHDLIDPMRRRFAGPTDAT
jgi:fatty-acyl-CoA synthase